jgi:hypothetical protein
MKNKIRKILVLLILFLILSASLIFAIFQNIKLQKEIVELNKTLDDVFRNTLDDFNLFLVEKLENCEAVTLVSEDKSITINNVHCKN